MKKIIYLTIIAFQISFNAFSQRCSEGVISVNFNDYGLAATDSAGVVKVANWNIYNGSMSDLLDHNGTTTTCDISSTTGNSYSSSDVVSNDDYKMMKGLIGTLSPSGFDVDITDIPYSFYDIYVYYGGRESTPGVIDLSINGSSKLYIRDDDGAWDGTYNQSTATTSGAAIDGEEYVIFKHLTDQDIKLHVGISDQRMGISGIQIVRNTTDPAIITSLVDNDTILQGDTIFLQVESFDCNSIDSLDVKLGNNGLYSGHDSLFSDTIIADTIGTYKFNILTEDNSNNIVTKTYTINCVKNQFPVVSMTGPADSSIYGLGDTVKISADVSDVDGTIKNVVFVLNDTGYLDTLYNAPYQTEYIAVDTGDFHVRAIATDNKDSVTVSDSINFTILTRLPEVVNVITPLDGETYYMGDNLQIEAEVLRPYGNVLYVKFLDGTDSIGVANSEPYTITINNIQIGSYEITAVAVDDADSVISSEPVLIDVIHPACAIEGISLNLNANNSLQPNDPAGVVELENWINVSDNTGSIANLNNNNGVTTTANYSWGGGNSYGTATVAVDPNSTMMKGTIADISGNSDFYITDIPYHTYDVYVYHTLLQRSGVTEGTHISVQINDSTTKYMKAHIAWDGTFDESTATTSGEAVLGDDHVVFRRWTADSIHINTVGSAQRVGPTAIQIIRRPEMPFTTSTIEDGDTITEGDTIDVVINGYDCDGIVDSMRVLLDGAILQEGQNTECSYTIENATKGTYQFTTLVMDDSLNITRDTIDLVCIANRLPSIAITSPLQNTTYQLNDTVYIIVSADDPDGNLNNIEVYADTNMTSSIGTISIALETLKWVPDTAGTYNLIAKAIDDKDSSSLSSPLTIKVEDGINIEEIGVENKVMLYPNPTNKFVYVKGAEGSTIEVVNISGQKIAVIKNASELETISLVNKGIYIVNINEQKYKVVVK